MKRLACRSCYRLRTVDAPFIAWTSRATQFSILQVDA